MTMETSTFAPTVTVTPADVVVPHPAVTVAVAVPIKRPGVVVLKSAPGAQVAKAVRS
jgi:hypothetical protein